MPVGDDNFQHVKRFLFDSFRRFVTGAPIGNTSASIRGTYYHKNFILEDNFWEKGLDKSTGTWPIVIDVSPSRGYFGSFDEPAVISPNIHVKLIFKEAVTQNLNFVVTVVTSTDILRQQTDNGKTEIIKV